MPRVFFGGRAAFAMDQKAGGNRQKHERMIPKSGNRFSEKIMRRL
jgi:hypothetical protein